MIIWSLITLVLGAINYVSLVNYSSSASLALPKLASIGVMLVSLGIAYRVWWEKRNGEIGKLKKRVDELEKLVREKSGS